MSKSRRHVIDPHLLLTHFGSDAVRYFPASRNSVRTGRHIFIRGIHSRVNADLANDFGNLVSRTLTLVAQKLQ
jgi:methionyl-tRNA synthetase